MMSTTTNRNEYDSRRLQHLLPQEIWLLICEKYCCPDQLENIYKSSSYFQNLLLNKRTDFFFPSVWKIIGNHIVRPEFRRVPLTLREFPDVRDNVCDLCKSLPCSCWCKNMTKIRLVSRSWCNGVDQFCQTFSCKEYLWRSMSNNHKINWFITNFETPDTLKVFNKHFAKTHETLKNRSPFIGKRVSLQIQLPFHNEDWIDMLQMLTNYGMHIFNCEICFESQLNTTGFCYKILCKLLKLMPNVKQLDLNYQTYPLWRWRLVYHDIPYRNRIEMGMHDELEQAVLASTLPRLHFLSSIGLRDFPEKIVYELVRVNTQVSAVKLVGYCSDLSGTFNFSRLSHLDLRHFSICPVTKSIWQTLKNSELSGNLTSLTLLFDDYMFLEWDEIFTPLKHKWNKTLTTLELDLPYTKSTFKKTECIVWSKLSELKLDNLAHIKITMNYLFILDFLLPLGTTLQSLSINVAFDLHSSNPRNIRALDNAKAVQVIQFYGFNDKRVIKKSNIWKHFPKLLYIEYAENIPNYSKRQCIEWVVFRSSSVHLFT